MSGIDGSVERIKILEKKKKNVCLCNFILRMGVEIFISFVHPFVCIRNFFFFLFFRTISIYIFHAFEFGRNITRERS